MEQLNASIASEKKEKLPTFTGSAILLNPPMKSGIKSTFCGEVMYVVEVGIQIGIDSIVLDSIDGPSISNLSLFSIRSLIGGVLNPSWWL